MSQNSFEQFINYQLDYLSLLNDKYSNDDTTFRMVLSDTDNTIKCNGFRGSGSTNTVANMFDVEYDIYVTHNIGCVREFATRANLDLCDQRFNYYTINQSTKNLDRRLRGKTIDSEFIYVWIDLGNYNASVYRDKRLASKVDSFKKHMLELFPTKYVIFIEV